jgi:acyl carrier protein
VCEIQDNVIRCIADQVGIDESKITPDMRLDDDLGLDSLDIVELSMELEDFFDIQIPDPLPVECRTVADLVALIKRKQGDA